MQDKYNFNALALFSLTFLPTAFLYFSSRPVFAQICGDGTCDTMQLETCATCPSDCGSCMPTLPNDKGRILIHRNLVFRSNKLIIEKEVFFVRFYSRKSLSLKHFEP